MDKVFEFVIHPKSSSKLLKCTVISEFEYEAVGMVMSENIGATLITTLETDPILVVKRLLIEVASLREHKNK